MEIDLLFPFSIGNLLSGRSHRTHEEKLDEKSLQLICIEFDFSVLQVSVYASD